MCPSSKWFSFWITRTSSSAKDSYSTFGLENLDRFEKHKNYLLPLLRYYLLSSTNKKTYLRYSVTNISNLSLDTNQDFTSTPTSSITTKMAPSATYPITSTHSGADLEAISDAVDEINVLKFKAAQQVTEILNDDSSSPSSPTSESSTTPASPTQDLGDFDTPSHFNSTKDHSRFRQYTTAESRVLNFYAEQHAKQTVSHNLAARARFNSPDRKRPEMTIWQAIECLNSLIDESDPDTELSQIQHLLQSAEAIRRDGKPRWMQLVGLIHDLGKLMLFFELATGQWDVVGDSFPVGCRFSEKCILPESFGANPDSTHPVYSTEHGIYAPGCGIENLMMSWGHDEYLYQVVKDQSLLPREGLAMIRFHSFYPWHREEAYGWAMKEGDEELRRAVRAFNPYDLYSKSDEPVDVEAVKPYYTELIDEFFPQKVIKW